MYSLLRLLLVSLSNLKGGDGMKVFATESAMPVLSISKSG